MALGKKLTKTNGVTQKIINNGKFIPLKVNGQNYFKTKSPSSNENAYSNMFERTFNPVWSTLFYGELAYYLKFVI